MISTRARYQKWCIALVAFNISFNLIGVDAADTQKPNVGKYAVGVPFFRIDKEPDIIAGKIFCVELKNGRKVLISALHLIGPAGGGVKQFNAAQCAKRIRKVDVLPTSGGKKAIATGIKELLTAGDLSRVESKDLRGDLVAFSVDDKCSLTPFKVSSKQPAVNTSAYIVSSTSDNRQGVFECTVTESTPKYVTIKLKKPTRLPGASGAPVIDSNGVVVGMVYGTNDNATYYLNPGASIYLRLNVELRKLP